MSPHPEPPPLRHDPDKRVAAMRETLVAQLTQAPARRSGRRRPFVAVTAASAVVAVAALAWSEREPAQALAVTTGDAVVELRIEDAGASSDAMTAALSEAGIRGWVLTVPSSPEHVGTWIHVGETAGLEPRSRCLQDRSSPPVVTRLSAVERDGAALRIPTRTLRESSGAFVFVAARPPRPGETVVHRGGPLRLAELDPATVPEELRALVMPPRGAGSCAGELPSR